MAAGAGEGWALRAAALSARVHHAIDEFAFFKGVLSLAGWVYSPDADVTSVTLSVPGGGEYPLRSWGLASPDVAAELGPGAQAARFAQTLQIADPVAQLFGATLRIDLVGHPPFSIWGLGQVHGDPAHALTARFQQMISGQPTGAMLEVGSRARSGVIRRELVPPGWQYTGLDILQGSNVDVVGDAHRLSTLFPHQHFDAVMAFSVLEHLMMPWKFVVELNRVLKPGALGVFTTHQCWPLHDQPWDFWRFSDRAWIALLNRQTGFEIIDAQLGEPCYVVAAKLHHVVAFGSIPEGRLASFVLFRKIGETTLDWPVDVTDLTETSYPQTVLDVRAYASKP